MVVPARAGVGPIMIVWTVVSRGGPRASGGRPGAYTDGQAIRAWSPRERG